MIMGSFRRLFSAAFRHVLPLGLVPLLSIAGCAPVDLLNATIPTGGVTIIHNIAYGPGPRQMLDLYRPDGKPTGPGGRFPVVVFFYGGSWRDGSKADYLFVAAALARRGILVMVPDYRLYPQTMFPGFLDDCATAVAWSEAHAADYGGAADDLFLMGHSAGAYNAVMLALDPAYLAAAGTSRDRLRGVIGLAGPYDFLPIVDPLVIAVFGSADNPATQPISYVDGRNPPLLLLDGSDDTTVLPRNTLALAAKVRAAGGPVQDKIYPGIGHVGMAIAFAPLFSGRAPVLPDVMAFIHAHEPAAAAGPIAAPAPAPATSTATATAAAP
jgi:acetyl esterase/lipase